MGCTSSIVTVTSAQSGSLYLIAVAAGILIFGVLYYTIRRKRDNGNETLLGEHLMVDAPPLPPSPPPPPVALPPIAAPAIIPPPETAPKPTPEGDPPVWLAPEVAPAQFEPSHLAAVASCEDSLPSFSEDDSVNNLCSLPSSSEPPKETEAPDGEPGIWLAPVT